MAETTAVRILVADDQVDVLNALRFLLSDEGYEVTEARSPGEALERLEAADFDLAILDLNYTRDTWPAYDLTTHGRTGVSVLAIGPVPTYYRRIVATAGETPAFCDGFTNGPSSDHRIQYLGALAGLEERALPLRGYEYHSVEAQNPAQEEAGIQRVKADVALRYAQLISLLVTAKLLPPGTAERAPVIDIEVWDHRKQR